MLVEAGIALLVLKAIVVLLEPRMAFFPSRGVQQTPADAGLDFQDLRIPTSDGETIHAWWIPHASARAQIVYWHGNGGNLSLWLDALATLHEQGWSVLGFDYRGYGASTGSPSERGIYRDTDAVLAYFAQHLRAAASQPSASSRSSSSSGSSLVPVIYWGRSLGGPAAAYGAGTHPPDALILEGTFPKLSSLFAGNPVMRFLSLFSSYRFPTSSFLRKYDGPVLLIHGDADTVIPFRHGQNLFDEIRSPKQFLPIAGADHNDFHPASVTSYWAPIRAFIEGRR